MFSGLARTVSLAHQSKYKLPAERVDFRYVQETYDKTHQNVWSLSWEDEKKLDTPELRLYCATCDVELEFMDAFDVPKRKFFCKVTNDSWGNKLYGCGTAWEQHQLDKMTKSEISSKFYSVPHVSAETIYVIDKSGTDGVRSFSFSRVANDAELVNYYHKALIGFREKLSAQRP